MVMVTGQHVREAKVLVVLRSADQLQEGLQPHDELVGGSVLGADHARVHGVGAHDVSRLADPLHELNARHRLHGEPAVLAAEPDGVVRPANNDIAGILRRMQPRCHQ